MKILVLNSGSSSIKFQLIEMPEENVLCKGFIERIGNPNSQIHYTANAVKHTEQKRVQNHKEGLQLITDYLTNPKIGLLENADDVSAVGHRVVHGGSSFSGATVINRKVLSAIERHSSLAPLHNPANVEGIKTASLHFKKAAQIAVFDTAYHQTMPAKAYKYAIPKDMAEKHAIRAYGFHGTSHKYVAEKAMNHLNSEQRKLISIHLGNGCSITAIKDGKSIDHSLGFGPSNGLIMGTRSGDIDQSVVFFLMDSFGHSSDFVKNMLQRKSGLLGLTGYSDMRDVRTKAKAGDKDCQLALEMTAYRIRKYIGSYIAALGGLDALIFTAGIGENDTNLRQMVCQDMEVFSMVIDPDKNGELAFEKGVAEIQSAKSAVKILVIPTNEELEIAKQCYALRAEKGVYNA